MEPLSPKYCHVLELLRGRGVEHIGIRIDCVQGSWNVSSCTAETPAAESVSVVKTI
jgi:hypothetical protein